MLSPFIHGNPENKQGFYGITNMNFQMNMASSANRAWRSARFTSINGGIFNKIASIQSFQSSTLTFTFITGHPSDALPSRNLVPHYELPVYRRSGPYDIPARYTEVDYSGTFTIPPTYEVRSNSIQLSQVPDKLIIFCQRTTKLSTDADAHFNGN